MLSIYHISIKGMRLAILNSYAPTDCTMSEETVAERLRHRSREQKVPSSIPRLGVSIAVIS